MTNNDSLEKIHQEALVCEKCPLCKTRTNAVPGQGNPKAKIFFIGEAPGFNEDQKGIPFCGAAGKILDELLESVGIKREDVFVGNILKCRPPGNRKPLKPEIDACTPYLDRQLQLIDPKVVCTLGNYATAYVFKKFGLEDKLEGISKIRGRVFETSSLLYSFKIIPLYHPAVATYNANQLPELKKDFEVLKKI